VYCLCEFELLNLVGSVVSSWDWEVGKLGVWVVGRLSVYCCRVCVGSLGRMGAVQVSWKVGKLGVWGCCRFVEVSCVELGAWGGSVLSKCLWEVGKLGAWGNCQFEVMMMLRI
jgi:hypothetical protein